MPRILFSYRGINFYSYSVMLYLGCIAGIFAGARIACIEGLSADRFTLAATVLVIPALLGSRLLFVGLHWNIYRREPARIWARAEGGMSLYGGFVLTIAVSPPLLHAIGLPFGSFWDAATFTMLLGTVITRIGCLLNGCCCGRPTTSWLGLRLPDLRGVRQRRIPTQLLESGYALTLFLLGLKLRPFISFPGLIFLLGTVSYGAGRFGLEGTRGDRDDTLPMRVISVMLVVSALASILVAWRYWAVA
jgi:phosphatidylglycerol:prolipoprotein diacylglycerol transferase